jgi:hypothetical protein
MYVRLELLSGALWHEAQNLNVRKVFKCYAAHCAAKRVHFIQKCIFTKLFRKTLSYGDKSKFLVFQEGNPT